jgi:hypothetical protein
VRPRTNASPPDRRHANSPSPPTDERLSRRTNSFRASACSHSPASRRSSPATAQTAPTQTTFPSTGASCGKPNALTLSISPLSDEDTARLLAVLLERPVLPAEVQASLLAPGGGNPLYAEQFARLIVEGGRHEELPLRARQGDKLRRALLLRPLERISEQVELALASDEGRAAQADVDADRERASSASQGRIGSAFPFAVAILVPDRPYRRPVGRLVDDDAFSRPQLVHAS